MEVIDMKLTPMADRVLLKPTAAEETTASGIILSTAAKEKPAIYEVVAVGPGDKDTVMVVKPGSKVVVTKFAGTEIKLDGVEYTIMKQADILAIVE